jgi:hypothetical protein
MRRSTGFKIGITLAGIHLGLVVITHFLVIGSRSSTAGLAYLWCFFVDSPLLFLPKDLFQMLGVAGPLIQFGLLGSILWFLIPWVADHAIVQIFPEQTRRFRLIGVLCVALATVYGFAGLSRVAITRSMRQQRPEELKKLIGSPSTEFLSGRIVLEYPSRVSGIFREACSSGRMDEFSIALPGGVKFIDWKYQELKEVNPTQRNFWTLAPVPLGRSRGCGFLAYRLNESVQLFDSAGEMLWTYGVRSKNSASMDGARIGDIDGDGVPEFAIYYRYREGIHLLDVAGNTRWKQPVYALGHIEFSDIDGDGSEELLLTNSNNANGTTVFTALDSNGTVITETQIPTKSFEFALVNWPGGKEPPFILLTEENQIRIVTQQGAEIRRLDAPGCRPFGKVKAVTVKFEKDEAEYLAVMKALHPDILVVYVYNGDGDLVFQNSEAIRGSFSPNLIAIPASEAGAENLLVAQPEDLSGYSITEYTASR